MSTVVADPIDSVLTSLGRRLPGTGRARTDILDEGADCLRSAQEDYGARGYDDARAAELAVSDFGPVEAVAADYRAELSTAAARRTALLMSIGYPALMALWAVVPAINPAPAHVEPVWVTGSFGWIAAAVVAAGAAILGLRRRARTGGRSERLVVLVPLLGAVAGILMLAAAVVTTMTGSGLRPPGLGDAFEHGVEWTSGVFIAATAFSAVRCLNQWVGARRTRA